MRKPRVLVVGGRGDGVPPELTERFEVVKHVSNEMGGMRDRLNNLHLDYVFIIKNFSSHQLIDRVRSRTSAPLISIPKGWVHMKKKLESCRILPPEVAPVAPRVELPGVQRCAYPPCSREATDRAPLRFGVFCCKVCRNAARRKGLLIRRNGR